MKTQDFQFQHYLDMVLNKIENDMFEVVSMDGYITKKCLLCDENNTENDFSEGLVTGVYFYKIISGGKVVKSGRLVIN